MKAATFLVFTVVLAAVTVFPKVSYGADEPAAGLARPGSINYVEGQASIGAKALGGDSAGKVELERGQSLSTDRGKVEILLTPGIFLRVADNSTVTMVSPELANTEVRIDKGRALVDAVDLFKENNIRIDQDGATIRILKNGLYDFDEAHGQFRVFEGKAEVRLPNQTLQVGERRMIQVGKGVLAKPEGFDRRQYEDDIYRWSALRSGYLSEASIDMARVYVGPGPGWYGPGWIGTGWYWDPWFRSYTFLPADGLFWSSFGWGFYSPIVVYGSPYFYGPHIAHDFRDFHGPFGHGYEPRAGRRARR